LHHDIEQPNPEAEDDGSGAEAAAAPDPIGTVSLKLFYIIIDELLDLFNAFHISFTFLWCGSSSC
jgi:hypothetical protein